MPHPLHSWCTWYCTYYGLDPRDLNKAIKHPHYSLPTCEGVRYFSVLKHPHYSLPTGKGVRYFSVLKHPHYSLPTGKGVCYFSVLKHPHYSLPTCEGVCYFSVLDKKIWLLRWWDEAHCLLCFLR